MDKQAQGITKEKLWTLNFLLLWQGQFISMMGDVIYEMALGFWILEVTGSTGLMGTLMAASLLPRIIVSPFAGVVVDRMDRKKIMLIMDFVRGGCIVFVAIAAFKGFLTIWMVFGAGVILGICGAFFIPAVTSAIPDIVAPSKMMSANSVFGLVQTGGYLIGNPLGGFLYQVLRAPFMFLFNGVSYILSGLAVYFIRIPAIERKTVDKHFFEDMKDGFRYIWKLRGLRNLLLIYSVSSFIVGAGTVLILPLFQHTESLGAARYGITMAFFTAGMTVGMLITSILPIPPHRRMMVFMICAVMSNVCYVVFGLVEHYLAMAAFLFIGAAFMSVMNVMNMTSLQLCTPQEMRGKVFALVGMIAQGLMPLGLGVGGVLGEFMPYRWVIASAFVVELLIFIPFGFMPTFKRFICFDPARETVEEIS